MHNLTKKADAESTSLRLFALLFFGLVIVLSVSSEFFGCGNLVQDGKIHSKSSKYSSSMENFKEMEYFLVTSFTIQDKFVQTRTNSKCKPASTEITSKVSYIYGVDFSKIIEFSKDMKYFIPPLEDLLVLDYELDKSSYNVVYKGTECIPNAVLETFTDADIEEAMIANRVSAKRSKEDLYNKEKGLATIEKHIKAVQAYYEQEGWTPISIKN
tara:strand:+ start:2468 stop:3106 length:639 start_codon:yes stop_codon:yes gene_type:complete